MSFESLKFKMIIPGADCIYRVHCIELPSINFQHHFYFTLRTYRQQDSRNIGIVLLEHSDRVGRLPELRRYVIDVDDIDNNSGGLSIKAIIDAVVQRVRRQRLVVQDARLADGTGVGDHGEGSANVASTDEVLQVLGWRKTKKKKNYLSRQGLIIAIHTHFVIPGR